MAPIPKTHTAAPSIVPRSVLCLPILVLLTGHLLLAVAAQEQPVCQAPIFHEGGAKRVYKVGVLAIRGVENANAQYNKLFSEYLTKAVGVKFDPPLTFEMEAKALDEEPLDFFASPEVDFVFSQSAVFSCLDTEVGATSLATQIAARKVNDEVYELTQFGGVIFVKNDENATDIQGIADIRGKRVAAASIIGLGSGQLQFLSLQRAGVHYLNGPSQVIFTGNQNKVVDAVMQGHVDVGFVRTDQLERSTDIRTGEALNLSLVRILDIQKHNTAEGELFPLDHTTDLVPEWNLAARSHVDSKVAQLVQQSLLDIADHADVVPALDVCRDSTSCNTTDCLEACFGNLGSDTLKNCDTNPDLAYLANAAISEANIAGWRSSLSYSSLRSLQDTIGSIQTDEITGAVKCRRAKTLADSIVCPEGHFKKREEDIENGCGQSGLDCQGYQCICSPCVEAFEADFYPITGYSGESWRGRGCPKLASCGSVEQGGTITFQVNDNRKRDNATFTARASIGESTESFTLNAVPRDNNTGFFLHEFTFDASFRPVGAIILEILVNDEQIPESPFRVTIYPRDCERETNDELRVADEFGVCVCDGGSVEVGSDCVAFAVLLPSILIPFAILVGVVAWLYVRKKRLEADALWKVDINELKMSSPPTVLGRGTFGLVLEAQYRGTVVAVKRVLPPVYVEGSSGTSADKNSMFGKFSFKGISDSNSELSHQDSISSDIADLEQAQPENYGTRSIQQSFASVSSRAGMFPLVWKKDEYEILKSDFIKEMRIIAQLRHPNITTVMGAVLSKTPMLIMERMQLGSLFDLLHNESMIIDGEIALPILQDIAQGVRFLHAAKPTVVHGDLKAANVLIDSSMRAKVADFGLSQKDHFRGRASGTPYWMSPELLRGDSGNTTASDIYAFGIVIYEVLSGKEPYAGEKSKTVLQKVADKAFHKRPPIPCNCPVELADLMKKCLSDDPAMRPTAEDVDTLFGDMEVATLDAGMDKSTGGKRGQAKQRARKQLHEVFPEHIAQALSQGEKIPPESHDCVTILFLQVVGKAKTDKLFAKLDALRKRHCVFRIDTANDESYMCATNLATEQDDHIEIMAKFALDAVDAAAATLVDLDDPTKGCVQIRTGFHSGPAVSHVIGSKAPRFSVIGDTVNTAAKMQQLSRRGKVQTTEVCVASIENPLLGLSVVRRGPVSVKGKGEMVAYFIERPKMKVGSSSIANVPSSFVSNDETAAYGDANVTEKLVDWNVSVMGPLILRIAAFRESHASSAEDTAQVALETSLPGSTVIDEVKEIVSLPAFDPMSMKIIKEAEDAMLPRPVALQLRHYVTSVAHLYNNKNCFHNFEHATSVIKSLNGLLEQVVSPEKVKEEIGSDNVETMHQYTCGISSDPLTQFACVFSALIHDADHPGVPNARLIAEKHKLAEAYNDVSIAEQNSVDLCWNLLMQPAFKDLLGHIAATSEEVARFRQLVVNVVLATDIVDKQLKALRNNRWKRAFTPEESVLDSIKDRNDRKATIVLEHMIQAADVSHTMSQWDTYRKWNECFFHECYQAFEDGRADTDPSEGWYKGEMGFYDFYIIPLAKKLFECKVFGESSHIYLDYAMQNRANWEQCGESVVAEMLENYHAKKNNLVTMTTEQPRPSRALEMDPSEQIEDESIRFSDIENAAPVNSSLLGNVARAESESQDFFA